MTRAGDAVRRVHTRQELIGALDFGVRASATN
jgi:hypothetical protein